MKRIVCVVGTRPEAIKMAPIVQSLRASGDNQVVVVSTGQHRELLTSTLSVFGIVPDYDLGVMQPQQTLGALTARLLGGLDPLFSDLKPDFVLAQGDTTTVLSAALASFYQRTPFGHVEAGLRTGRLDNPFPEEMNRVIAGRLAKLHFAPTEQAKSNLLAEGIDAPSVFVTGNTVIDALLDIASRPDLPRLDIPDGRRIILVTTHRRESFGAPLLGTIKALQRLVEAESDVHVVLPVHPNPNVQIPVRAHLGSNSRVSLTGPMEYKLLVSVMKRAHFILTDSGGLQEEAPALGKPVLVLRETSERPEAIEAGLARLVGTDPNKIFEESRRLLTDPAFYASMVSNQSPYGDGAAATRIAQHVADFLGC